MTIRLADRGIDVLLLDIEGTTTPIAFVHEILFPFARTRLASWLATHADAPDTHVIIRTLGEEHAAERVHDGTLPPWRRQPYAATLSSAVAYAEWLMDRDRKSPGLKDLQGLIWKDGYEAGELHGDVYPDVPPAMRRWREAGVRVAIYSSGSELAQRLLFQSTAFGDLSVLIDGYFDTRVGPKRTSDSYRSIADALRAAPGRILFSSDVTAELTAAREAGCQVVLSVRPGNVIQDDADRFEQIGTLAEIA